MWLAKWSSRLQLVFAGIGLVVVLLPVLSKPWSAVIDGVPFVSRVFHDFSTLSGWALANFFVLMMLFLARSAVIRNIPGGHVPIRSWREVVDMELYPRTRKEELAYWSDFAFAVAGTTLWLFLPFGVLAYFIRLGG